MGKIIDADDAIKAIRVLPRWILDPKGEFQPVEPPTKSMIDPDDAVAAIENLPRVRPDFDTVEKIDKAFDDGYKQGYLQAESDLSISRPHENDLISRSAALRSLGGPPPVWQESDYEIGMQVQWTSDFNAIKSVLPAQSEPQWIPCSENLPTKEGHYLCSFKEPSLIDRIHVKLAYWTGGRWYGYLANEINAWTLLPEPYAERRE